MSAWSRSLSGWALGFDGNKSEDNMLIIRLQRRGTIRKLHHRIVIAESRSKKPGRSLEELGSYHPAQNPVGVILKRDRVAFWVQRGAQLSPTVAKLVRAYDRKQTATTAA